MSNRCLGSILVALVIALGAHRTVAAARPLYLVCELENASEIRIVIEHFDGMHDAVHHCLFFWNGKPRGVER